MPATGSYCEAFVSSLQRESYKLVSSSPYRSEGRYRCRTIGYTSVNANNSRLVLPRLLWYFSGQCHLLGHLGEKYSCSIIRLCYLP